MQNFRVYLEPIMLVRFDELLKKIAKIACKSSIFQEVALIGSSSFIVCGSVDCMSLVPTLCEN